MCSLAMEFKHQALSYSAASPPPGSTHTNSWMKALAVYCLTGRIFIITIIIIYAINGELRGYSDQY